MTALVDREAKQEVGSLSDYRMEFERQHRCIFEVVVPSAQRLAMS